MISVDYAENPAPTKSHIHAIGQESNGPILR